MRKTQETLIFSFYAIFSTPILYQSPTDSLENGFSHSISSMFHVSRRETLEEAHSGVVR